MLCINNEEFDPYFILGVTENDNIEHVNKTFRKKARILHPDKMNELDKRDNKKVSQRNKHFKILIDCYEYIIEKKTPFLSPQNQNAFDTYIDVDTNLNKENFVLDEFNKKFEKLHVQNPNDLGYDVERIKSIHDYENQDLQQNKLFSKYNNIDFNKTFEFNDTNDTTNDNSQNTELTLFKTVDGFYGFNTLSLANVIGNNTLGANSYADYKSAFSSPKTPKENPIIPSTFKLKKDTVQLKTKEELIREMNKFKY